MEFRIAPLIMAVVNLVFILFVNPDINRMVPLSEVANVWRILILFAVIMAMSIGSFLRHSYYSKGFKAIFFLMHLANVALAVYYIVAIRAQHFG